jgi:L-aspartate oxidase
LYAAGEAAGTGVHGANRLASNSLLEGLVFGARAGRKMRDELKAASHSVRQTPPAAAYSNGPLLVPVETTITQIQELMWKQVGIVRTGAGLKQAIGRLEELGTQLKTSHSRREFEARNLQLTGTLVAKSALAREESRGAHYRTDFPDHNDAKFKKHSVVAEEKTSFE